MDKPKIGLAPDLNTNVVYKTLDLDKFQVHLGNRPINEAHLKRLMNSINEENLLSSSPIVVNEKFEIIDGQHRLEAARRLELPIYYIKVEKLSLKDIQRLNTNNKNWTASNYLEAYCLLGKRDYLMFRDFLDESDINIATGLLLVHGSGRGDSSNKFQEFRDGRFRIKNISEVKESLAMVLSFKPYYENVFRRGFVLAILKLKKIKEYSHKQMLNKLSLNPDKLIDQTSQENYLRNLEEIYNSSPRTIIGIFKGKKNHLKFF